MAGERWLPVLWGTNFKKYWWGTSPKGLFFGVGYSFNILFGILFGPTALWSLNESIMLDTSVLSVGAIKNEFLILIWGKVMVEIIF